MCFAASTDPTHDVELVGSHALMLGMMTAEVKVHPHVCETKPAFYVEGGPLNHPELLNANPVRFLARLLGAGRQ